MMLEEALLYLLEVSGYRRVEGATASGKNDPTLQDGTVGLEVLGRGEAHQIDAVADLAIAQPFSLPQRLLIEGKFRPQKTGIEVVRNAIAILKDIREYWVGKDKVPPKARYQYQYAIFSVSSYTSPAQQYAYAHDIYLIPLEKSAFFQPIIKAIKGLAINNFNTPVTEKALSQLRKAIREGIRDSQTSLFRDFMPSKYIPLMENFCRECRWVNGALIGMMARQFPILLVPHPDVRFDDLKSQEKVEIYTDGNGYYLRQASSGNLLFSFELPEDLFNLYAEQDILLQMQTFDYKTNYMLEIQSTVICKGEARAIAFQLDNDWLDQYRDRNRDNIDKNEETKDKN